MLFFSFFFKGSGSRNGTQSGGTHGPFSETKNRIQKKINKGHLSPRFPCADSDSFRFSTNLGYNTLFTQERGLRGKQSTWPVAPSERAWSPLVIFPAQGSGTPLRLYSSGQRAKVVPARWWSCQASRITTSLERGLMATGGVTTMTLWLSASRRWARLRGKKRFGREITRNEV